MPGSRCGRRSRGLPPARKARRSAADLAVLEQAAASRTPRQVADLRRDGRTGGVLPAFIALLHEVSPSYSSTVTVVARAEEVGRGEPHVVDGRGLRVAPRARSSASGCRPAGSTTTPTAPRA